MPITAAGCEHAVGWIPVGGCAATRETAIRIVTARRQTESRRQGAIQSTSNCTFPSAICDSVRDIRRARYLRSSGMIR